MVANCVPRRQLGSCIVTRPFLSAKGVACETSSACTSCRLAATVQNSKKSEGDLLHAQYLASKEANIITSVESIVGQATCKILPFCSENSSSLFRLCHAQVRKDTGPPHMFMFQTGGKEPGNGAI